MVLEIVLETGEATRALSDRAASKKAAGEGGTKMEPFGEVLKEGGLNTDAFPKPKAPIVRVESLASFTAGFTFLAASLAIAAHVRIFAAAAQQNSHERLSSSS